MRRSKLAAIAAIGVVVLLGSCSSGNQEANKSQLFNSAAGVDSEGFDFFKTVHGKAVFELELAKQAASVSTSAEVKALSGKITETYSSIIPELESMAADVHVILPDPGAPVFEMPAKLVPDSLAGFDDHAYLEHFAHEQKVILDQFNRVDRNTYKPLNHYAKEKLPAIKALYAAAGGEEDHGAHH